MKKSPIAAIICLAILMGSWQPHTLFADDRDTRQRDLSRIRKKIETLRAWQLTEELDLDEDTSARLFTAMKSSDRERWEIETRNRELVRELSRTVQNRNPDSGKINQILNELKENRRELVRSEERHIDSVRKILSPADTARYLIFQIRFQAQIKQKAAQAMRDRRPLEDDEMPMFRDRSDNDDSRDSGSGGGGGRKR